MLDMFRPFLSGLVLYNSMEYVIKNPWGGIEGFGSKEQAWKFLNGVKQGDVIIVKFNPQKPSQAIWKKNNLV